MIAPMWFGNREPMDEQIIAQQEFAELFTEKEAAALLQMTIRMLRRRRRLGQVLCVQDQGYVVHSLAHLIDYLHHSRRGSPQARSNNQLILTALISKRDAGIK
jgi:hypothetical protein